MAVPKTARKRVNHRRFKLGTALATAVRGGQPLTVRRIKSTGGHSAPPSPTGPRSSSPRSAVVTTRMGRIRDGGVHQLPRRVSEVGFRFCGADRVAAHLGAARCVAMGGT